MIVVQNHIKVKQEYREEFEKRFSGRVTHLKEFPGFVRNEVMRPIKGDSYIVMTFWESMEAFDAWVNSEEFRKSHSGGNPEMFDGPNTLSVHQVFSSTVK